MGGDAPTGLNEKKNKSRTKKIPDLEEYLQQRDYLGALTLLEVDTESYTSGLPHIGPLPVKKLGNVSDCIKCC